jgi:tetratricopeptide (TPR) repeat protein
VRERGRPPGEALRLVDQGRAALDGGGDSHLDQAIVYLREATRLAPDHADAWGVLALAYGRGAVWVTRPDQLASAARARAAAARALALDKGQPDARLALIAMQPFFGNWARIERSLRGLLETHPDHRVARMILGSLLGETGRFVDSLPWLTPLAGSDGFNPLARYRYIYALWHAGRLEEAEAALAEAYARWPRHGAIWRARIKFLTYTGRPETALALLMDETARPEDSVVLEKEAALIRAVKSRRRSDIDDVVRVQLASIERNEGGPQCNIAPRSAGSTSRSSWQMPATSAAAAGQ